MKTVFFLIDFQREEELAFVTANLHLHHLAERSTLGSAALYVSVRRGFEFVKSVPTVT